MGRKGRRRGERLRSSWKQKTRLVILELASGTQLAVKSLKSECAKTFSIKSFSASRTTFGPPFRGKNVPPSPTQRAQFSNTSYKPPIRSLYTPFVKELWGTFGLEIPCSFVHFAERWGRLKCLVCSPFSETPENKQGDNLVLTSDRLEK